MWVTVCVCRAAQALTAAGPRASMPDASSLTHAHSHPPTLTHRMARQTRALSERHTQDTETDQTSLTHIRARTHTHTHTHTQDGETGTDPFEGDWVEQSLEDYFQKQLELFNANSREQVSACVSVCVRFRVRVRVRVRVWVHACAQALSVCESEPGSWCFLV